MALRKIKFVENEIYHVYNRGSFKHEIFHSEIDYERFKKILYISNGTKKFKFKELLKYEKNAYEYEKGEDLVNILAYVLMPNHFHLMVQVKSKNNKSSINSNLDNNLSVFMKRLTSAYSMYYNYRYNKTGRLFEGKFKAEHVDNDTYFRYLFSYIHLNPVKLIQSDWKELGIKDIKRTNEFLEGYKHSSFQDYFLPPGKPGGGIVNKKEFLNKVPENTDLSKEILDWLKFK